MHYLQADFSKPIPFAEAFPGKEVFQHGQDKVGFGIDEDSKDNPTEVTVEYFNGNHLLEVADWSDGSSGMGATMGGNRDLIVTDSNGRILGVLEYRQGSQPTLKVNGKTVEGGASRFSSFVSQTGAADEDPKPQHVSDSEGQREVNRNTGQAAHGRYFVTIRRTDAIEGEAYAALTLQYGGHTPKTDVEYVAPQNCAHCGK